MEPQAVTTPQPTETLGRRLSRLGSSGHITVRPRPDTGQCPECGHPGPHQKLTAGWVECANYHRTRLTTGWAVCGATWRANCPVRRPNPVRDRLIVLLAASGNAGVVDGSTVDTVLCDDTIIELADRIAGDRDLRAHLLSTAGDAA